MHHRTLLVAYLPLLGLTSCLPADDRPAPGSLLVTASPSTAVERGMTTDDGWTLTYDRVLVGLGRVWLGEDCTSYATSRYDRVFDVTQSRDQKLSIEFGLGQCDLRFRMAAPAADALLGAGVLDADRDFMRTPADDPYVKHGGVALEVDGSASKANASKTFQWIFRQTIRYDQCGMTSPGGTMAGVNLASGTSQALDIEIDAERLFRDDLVDASAVLRFEPFAEADTIRGNGDGVVTLDELAEEPLGQLRVVAPYGIGMAKADQVVNLRDYLYLVLLPIIPLFRDTIPCSPSYGLDNDHGFE